MMKRFLTLLLLLMQVTVFATQRYSVYSPDKDIRFDLVIEKTALHYDISYKGQILVRDSRLGFSFDNGDFGAYVKASSPVRRTIDETYHLVMGKTSKARNHCNSLVVSLTEQKGPGRRIDLEIRVSDDGAAFRYIFPEQPRWNRFLMYDEMTQFNLSGDPQSLLMYLPGFVSAHEGTYHQSLYSQIRPDTLIEMPATFQFGDNVFVSITEAAIRDYAGMSLMRSGADMTGRLSPLPGQEKVKVKIDSFPHKSPWRVVQISSSVGGLIESDILTDLNEPCASSDTSWIKPCRTTFTWWNGDVVPDTTFSPGNNFQTNAYYIDFAAANGLDAHDIYGYAETPWYVDDNFNFGVAGAHSDVTKPIPSLDMPRIVAYARNKGIGLHLWVNWKALYPKMEEAFALYESWGVKGLMVDFMDRDDQEMIRIQEEILQCAFRHHLFIQFHGASKPSGLIRTYPNEFTREGTMNYECCKWSKDITSDHDISIPFTRMLAGSTDYHLGGFRALPRSDFKVHFINPYVMSTRCHMLAMYVVLENHIVMLCDTPQAYKDQPGFEVLRSVPGNWDETRVPAAMLNQYLSVARRSGQTWWVGTINNGTPRTVQVPMDFLGSGEYEVRMYKDAPDCGTDPDHLVTEDFSVRRGDSVRLDLPSDGGAVFIITK
jgi:alpha-glucosidase